MKRPHERQLGRLLLLLGAGLGSLQAACTHAPPPAAGPASATSAKPPAAPASPASPAKTAPAAQEVEIPKLEPPDGKWLVDANGREYFLTDAPRIEGQYRWENPEMTVVRLPFGLVMDVVDYDDERFVVKIYRPDNTVYPSQRRVVTPEAKAQAAAEFVFATPPADRLVFGEFDHGLPRRGQWRNGFDVADFDGDGLLDIVHGPARKGNGRPTIFRGDGKGGWQVWPTRFPADTPLDYGDVATADFDGDGHLDVALGMHLRGVGIFRGDGAGTFTRWSNDIPLLGAVADLPTPPFSSRAIAVGDWNRDGRPDVIANGEGPRFAASRDVTSQHPFAEGSRGFKVFLNQGNGTWWALSEPGERSYGSQVALGDLDGDGDLDAAAGVDIADYETLIVLGAPDASLRRVSLQQLRPGSYVRAVATGDFDADGRLDLALGYYSNALDVQRSGVDVLLARGTGWERRTVWNIEDRRQVFSIAAGDVDGDGHLDLAAGAGNGTVELFLGDGRGGFVHEDAPELSVGDPNCRDYGLGLVDLDGDARAEVVAGFAGEGNELMGERLCPSGGALRVWHATPK